MHAFPNDDTRPEPPFPPPKFKAGMRRHWKLSDLLEYEAAAAGEEPPEPLPPDKERFLTAKQLRERYGVSDMWIWRRLKLAEEADHAAT